MPTAGPVSFYTGLVAELYAPLRSERPDPVPYERFVRRHGEPALELACGDGDPMLDLVAAGLDVHGLDSSADMLARCRRRAAERGVTVTLHHQTMQAVDLPWRYRSMYLAGASFNLLPDDDAAQAALRAMVAHLEPGGAALVPLFVPEPVVVGLLPRWTELPDGVQIRCGPVATSRDEGIRTQVTTLRYERKGGDDDLEVAERDWLLHWHTPAGFAALAQEAGLEVVGQRSLFGGPADETTAWTALLREPG